MKKRLLCYDEDNPVGIDENGVLNPSALQPYYSKKVLFKALTKDDFTKTVVHDVVDMYFYSFGSKLDWLTSEDSIHVEYRIEYNDGEIIESSSPIITSLTEENSDNRIMLQIDEGLAIANGYDITMNTTDDCMVVPNINMELVKEFKFDLYKVETNKLSSDLVEGVVKLKVFDFRDTSGSTGYIDATKIEECLTHKTIIEIEKYYKKGYLIGFKKFIMDNLIYDDIVFIYDIDFPLNRDFIKFTALCNGKIVHYDGQNKKIDWWYGNGYQKEMLMYSESGNTRWKITVNDDGTISATKV